MFFNFSAGNTDVLIIIADKIWTDHAVITSFDSMGSSWRHYKINIFELVPTLDYSCDQVLLV